MKHIITFLSLTILFLITGCNSGKQATSYSTILGDITIVDNGGTNTSSKTNTADVAVGKGLSVSSDKINIE